MKCAEFENVVHGVVRPDTLDKAAAVMAKFHAQTCERCAARLAQAQLLALALDAAAQDSAALEAPPHLESALVSAFREHHRGFERTRHERRTRLRWLEGSALAVAAAVLLAIGAWNFSRPRVANIPGGHASRQGTPLAPEANSASSGSQNEMVETAVAQSDATADFVPVPYGETFAPGDSGVIVRVEMPRSALAD
ncbi:MAG: hypothetical protein ACRD37_01990, partial [Candidatus Acidiferrales bacterium]